jgi:Mg2+ and Co2+ transporter CorA
LRNAKTKLGDKREAIQTLTRAKEELERTNQILAAAAKNSAIQLRIAQQEIVELKSRLEHGESRNDNLMGKYLRLEEDHAVLKTINTQDTVS